MDLISLISVCVPVIVTVAIPSIGHFYSRKTKLATHYLLIWQKASSLKQNEALRKKLLDSLRPFPHFYLRKREVAEIEESINQEESIVIVGKPLSGKTRMVYESIRDKPWDVLLPKLVDINPETFILPKRFTLKPWRQKIVILDDLQRWIEVQNFDILLRDLTEKSLIVVATCRSSQEELKVKNYFTAKNLDYGTFFPKRISLKDIEREDAEDIAKKENKDWDKDVVRFNGTVGSIFMKLGVMKGRFESCNIELKTILRVLRQLYRCGIYEENQFFPTKWIKQLSEVKNLSSSDYQWIEWFKQLSDAEFLTLRPRGEGVEAEEVYLEDETIIQPELSRNRLEEMDETLEPFGEESDALIRLGDRAYDLGKIDSDKVHYQHLAIKAYKKALIIYTPSRFPRDYAMTQHNLGNAYQALADVEDKRDNCKKAIKAYEQALNIRTRKEVPMDYAKTMNNLGTAYRNLAEVENKRANCEEAIKAYREALKIRTRKEVPMDYAMTMTNLGAAYRTLAEVENKRKNCKKAIAACEEALEIRTRKEVPNDFAKTHNNLGAAYRTLAEIENKGKNCKEAIKSYLQALKIRTFDKFPIYYANTQNNLGVAYRTLAEVEDKRCNCERAIKAYKKAFRVRKFPELAMDYAQTQNNLGDAYRTLAEVENNKGNCERAIEAYLEALKIRTIETVPMDYAQTQNNLGDAYRTFAEVEDKRGNCERAIEAYRKALEVFAVEKILESSQTVNNKILEINSFLS
ncbi:MULTISPECIES: tetratricopeptide repeat protein [Kamptonema]|uniref:tetratricopeptide repeat protein n=1 Tax=Kamptonema TaxID=1501433 RepID=UPI0001DAD115|nr:MULTISPECIES: tetratricopeptide repeat protein [Kamptonema]CBN58811.1 hypothetical protein OSCI_3890027 [Kamptonema sp. PCC 6506]